jgi:hypothetical protein
MIHCRKPAAYVVRDRAGAEWFVCEEHGDPSAEGVRWVTRTTLADWYQARAMALSDDPRRVCNEARKEQLPPGFVVNSAAQKERMRTATRAVLGSLEGTGIAAVAVVFAMPDGTVTATIAGDADNLPAIASIMDSGPEVLRMTVARMLQGKGETRIVPGSL